MAQKQFKIGLSNTDKQNMAQDVYERVLALTFNEYDTTTEYEVGDFVVYNDQLYKCIGATSGAWDSTKWQLATLNDLVTDIESAVAFVNDKANVNGNYPTMTVGFADNLTPYDESAGDDQDEPFSFQATGTGNGTQPDFSTGSGALMKEKQGNTVVVNQLYENYNFATNDKYSIPESAYVSGSVANNKLTLTVLQNFSSGVDVVLRLGKTTIEGHKYLFFANVKSVVGNNTIRMANYTKTFYKNTLVNQGETKLCVAVGQETAADVIATLRIQGQTNSGNKLEVSLYCAIDLTQWFGSNDNIPAHLLAHPEDFFRYYQGSLAYNVGTLVNANGRYIKCIGMNQWDGTNDVKAIPNATYYINGSATLTYKDREGNTISSESKSNQTFVAPSNCLSIGVSGSGDISINLYYEDEPRCLTYEPYQVLTNNDTGTEVLRSAGSVKDSKAPDGTITRRIGVVDLGTLDWETYSSPTNHAFRISLTGIGAKPTTANNVLGNAICPRYTLMAFEPISANDNMCFAVSSVSNNRIVFVNQSYSTAADFKTAMSGVYLFYELAEPTTEQGTPFSENLVIDDFGSMDFEGTSGVPQGNLIFYPVDYKAFIDTLYKYTDGTPSNIALKSDLSGLVAQTDLSNGIAAGDGITIIKKKLYKIGSVCTLSLIAQNTSGNAISSWTALATIPSGGYDTTNNIKSICIINNNEIGGLNISTGGLVACMDKALSAGESIYINITYTVA